MPELDSNKITDNLLSVYNYTFTESVPYGFYKPNKEMYVGVRLTQKKYHCPSCKQEFTVQYSNHNDGITYFSKSRIASQKKVYDKLGLLFPADWELMEKPFTYEAIGYCEDCARKRILNSTAPGQVIVNLCHELHGQDELIAAKSKQYMTDAVQHWLDTITESAQLEKFDMSTHDNLRDLCIAVIISDNESMDAMEKALQDYRDAIQPLIFEIRRLNRQQTPAWKAYVARTSTIYESMSDEEYHEYTVAFPAEGTQGRDFYIQRSVEQERVDMFLSQRRIASLEEMLTDTGFHEEWIDMVVDKVTSLKK